MDDCSWNRIFQFHIDRRVFRELGMCAAFLDIWLNDQFLEGILGNAWKILVLFRPLPCLLMPLHAALYSLYSVMFVLSVHFLHELKIWDILLLALLDNSLVAFLESDVF